jgi:hypothetical protein
MNQCTKLSLESMVDRGQRPSRFMAALVVAVFGLWLFATTAGAAEFEIPHFSAGGYEENQQPSTGAGQRPWALTNSFDVSTVNPGPPISPSYAAGDLKDVDVDLPPGMLGNAASFPRCTQFLMDEAECPKATQVGIAEVRIRGFGGEQLQEAGIFNLVPPPGMPAQLGFKIISSVARVNIHVRSGSDYGVTGTVEGINESAPVFAQTFTLWGVPGDPGHDAHRYTGQLEDPGPYPEGAPYHPFISNPTSCTGALTSTASATTWQNPAERVFAAPAKAPGLTGCDQVGFDPSIDAQPTTTHADSPSGFDFHLRIPQNQDASAKATATLRDTSVMLPPSLDVNPSSANGLAACSAAQIGFTGSGDEKQTLSYRPALAVSFVVSDGGQSTPPIAAKAGAAQVKGAIESLPGLAGNIGVTGSPGSWTVSFSGALAGTDVPELSGTVTDNFSQNVTVTGESGFFNLNFGGVGTGAKFEATFGSGEQVLTVTNLSRELKQGEPVLGPGIAEGTTVVGAFGSLAIIDRGTIEEETDAQLETIGSPFDISANGIESVLQSLPPLQGNVLVTAVGGSGATRSFEIVFNEGLSGVDPPLLTATSALTGTDAGVAIARTPNTPRPLNVETTAEAGPPQFSEAAAECPDASKIGTVEILSPAVIDHPLKGSVYLATPHENPFDSLLAMYIAVDDPQTGVVVKLPGLIEADPKTGQLTATVSEAPQLPFEDLSLSFFKGDAAPLKTGITCGTYETKTDMVPWTAPQGETKHPGSIFTISQGCSGSEAQAPNAPSFEAGTVNPSAGAYSPFVLKLSRADGTQQLTGIDTTLPKGVLARLAGIPYCSDQALAAAAQKSGKQEQASPSCPAGSRVGSVMVGAGAGGHPFYAPGYAYLAGPYKGAPLSLAVVTPAVAGPFDLGTVVVRNALYVDTTTAQVHAVSDPFPHILQGIPLDIRSISLTLDKPSFTLNPTNCSRFAITGAIQALTGQSAPVSNPFQAVNCGDLGFKPKLSLTFKGQTKRTGNPALNAVLKAPVGEANIAATTVILPSSQFIDNRHINNPCTRVQFNEDACPAKSILGTAVAWSPLLEKPLEGPIYFRSNGGERELPDLVADLSGQIHVTLVGFIDSIHIKGTEKSKVRTRFTNVPDAPVSRFELKLYGGKRGLIQNSQNLCKGGGVGPATVQMDGQNGKTSDTEVKLGTSCPKAKHHKQKSSKKKSSKHKKSTPKKSKHKSGH